MSVNIWNAEKQEVDKIAGNVNINDGAISENSSWSSKKINANLGEIEKKAGNVYSTEETVIGKWIDGRPIYSKTFSNTLWTPNTELLSDVDVIVSFDGMYKYTQLGVYMNLSYRDNYGSFRVDLNPNTHKVVLNCVGSEAIFTIKYVKTTD